MYIENLKLLNYRNYSQLNLNFHPKINIITGSNAQGKTNIIEAIYYLAIGKSHRTNKDREVINWDSENSYIRGTIITNKGKRVLEMGLSKSQKKIMKNNGIVLERIGDLLGKVNIVLFSPEDLKLIKEGPMERRNFLDREISNIKPQYYYGILKYHKILAQRNHLLKNLGNQQSLENTISLWDQQLAEVGSWIIHSRIYFLKKLNGYINRIHREITDDKEDLVLFYQSNILKSQEEIKDIKRLFQEKLRSNRGLDIKRGVTSVGPHRDDLKVSINKIDLRAFGSQGQQRTAALSLKLSILELIDIEIGERPILLLDDVLSELDEMRQEKLIKSLENVQSFITCADRSYLQQFKDYEKNVFTIEKGQIV